MTSRNRSILIAVAVIVIGIAGWLYFRSGRENVAIDLMKEFPTLAADKRRPDPGAFSIIDATINGDTRKAIFTKEMAGTRITWHETVPENAWLKLGFGVLEEGWKVPGDGVYFAIGVSTGSNYDELLTVTYNPNANAGDRRWNDIQLDLSQYGGEAVDIILNTRSSTGGKDDRNGDLAVWAAPRIVVR
jgi:hypothetical protein